MQGWPHRESTNSKQTKKQQLLHRLIHRHLDESSRFISLLPTIMTKTTFLLAAACVAGTHAFVPAHPAQVAKSSGFHVQSRYNVAPLQQSAEENQESNNEDVAIELTAEEKEAVGNLVADEEWAGLSMELADVVRTAVVEDLKKNSRDFLGKDDYAIGDFSKEVDRRVKEEVAKMREKDEYELGDLSVVLDGKVKELVCELSGKEEVSNMCIADNNIMIQFKT